jgi:release factor glutamine methyltransferase
MNGQLAGNRLKDIYQWAESKLSHWEDRERKSSIKWMFSSLLSIDATELVINPNKTFSESEILKVHFAIKRLLNNEPLQYVLNESYFMGRLFKLEQSVLIPRPETEEIVQSVIPHIQVQDVVLDLGTGSGCIAITIALESKAKVFGVDLSEDALVVAKDNAIRLGAKVDWFSRDMRDIADLLHSATIIISNPPYVLESDKGEMQAQVLDHEPHMALFVPDEDPLMFYQSIVAQVQANGDVCRMVVFETHESYAHQVAQLFDEHVWKCEVKKDLQKKDRMVIAIKQ